MITPQKGSISTKVLLSIVLAALGVLTLWWIFGRSRGNGEIDQIVTADRDSSVIWKARIDSLAKASSMRDSAMYRDSVQESQLHLRVVALGNRIADLHVKLGVVTEARESLRVYIQLDTFHTNRHEADSNRIFLLKRTIDTLKIDRAKWKEYAVLLNRENARLTKDIFRLGQIAKQSCDLLIVHIPCPELVVGPGASVSATGHVQAGLQVTGGIPIHFGKRAKPPSRSPSPSTVPSHPELPVVSPAELVP